jgi:hypothetical protein
MSRVCGSGLHFGTRRRTPYVGEERLQEASRSGAWRQSVRLNLGRESLRNPCHRSAPPRHVAQLHQPHSGSGKRDGQRERYHSSPQDAARAHTCVSKSFHISRSLCSNRFRNICGCRVALRQRRRTSSQPHEGGVALSGEQRTWFSFVMVLLKSNTALHTASRPSSSSELHFRARGIHRGDLGRDSCSARRMSPRACVAELLTQ